MNKALILQRFKKYDELREALEEAFNIDPNYADVNNFFAEYYLSFGDLKNASKCVENAILIDKENAFSLGIKGKIKIEEQDYVKSSEYFKRAISSDLMNPNYLIWNSYAKYLNAELEFSLNEKRYQDTILAIIRELEKVEVCISQENKSYLKTDKHLLKHFIASAIIFTKRIIIYLNLTDNLKLKLLRKLNSLLKKFESPHIIAYNYYFLGCFYYKVNDYFTAVNYLKKCKNLKPDPDIEKSAQEILENICNSKIRPSIWKWWLYSPINFWFKRFSFVILLLALLGILLPSLASKLLFSLYLIVEYQQILNYQIVKPVMSAITFVTFSLGEFFSLINWQENTVSLTFLTLIIIFILGSPVIQRFKGSNIEIEIRSPPAFELTPSLFEKKLKNLESNFPQLSR
jgi:tetratricopeptide (TPR) repeat protein